MASSLSSLPVLMTGAAGFLGRLLLKRLLREGALVTTLDQAPAPADLAQAPNLNWLRGALDSADDIAKAVWAAPPPASGQAVLFHLAAMNHAGECNHDPERARAINTRATLELAQAWGRAGHRRMVFCSSAQVYAPSPKGRPLSEDDPTEPRGAYAKSKLDAEQGLIRLSREQDLAVEIARLSNVYGPGAHPDTVVMAAMDQALSPGGEISLRDYSPVRDFIYCRDVVEGLLALALAGGERGTGIYNLSTGQGSKVGQVAAILARLSNKTAPKAEAGSRGDVLVLNSTKLRQCTGWRPAYDLEQGLTETYRELSANGQT